MKKIIKGFTLVEVIVVMVIIAILAALFMPSLTKYIDKANSTQTVINARQFYVAAQAAISEQYAINYDKIQSTTKEFKDPKTGERVARMTNGSFASYQNSNYYKNPNANQVISNYNMMMCKKVLYYLECDSKDSAAILFHDDKPMGQKPSDYYKKTANLGQPMIALYYNNKGKIVFLEYADESLYKVTIRDNEITIEKDGVFTKT